jgi:hypothetical protein
LRRLIGLLLPALQSYLSIQTMRSFLLLASFALCFSTAYSQGHSPDSLPKSTSRHNWADKLHLLSYGMMNYHRFDWQTWPEKRDEVDFERVVIEGDYRFAPKWTVNAELEFEHGGTGVTVEFDRFEEFGEFEYEVEKGGEVRFEEFNLGYDLAKNHQLKVGYVKVPFGLITFRDEPDEYLTNTLPVMENTLLPTDWAEFGFLYAGKAGNWQWHAAFVNGLDGTAFNSANFIKRGNQKRFETVNANDWAAVLRLDYVFGHEQALGFSYYTGNTSHNRPKPDLLGNAWLNMLDVHFAYELEPFQITLQGLYGSLQNADAVSNANRNLSNNLNVKRTPVGSAAAGYAAELGFEVFELLKHPPKSKLIAFARIDSFDSMYKVEGNVSDNPRWQRDVYTAGLNWLPVPQIVIKSQYSVEKLGVDTDKWQRTYSVGIGFHIE